MNPTKVFKGTAITVGVLLIVIVAFFATILIGGKRLVKTKETPVFKDYPELCDSVISRVMTCDRVLTNLEWFDSVSMYSYYRLTGYQYAPERNPEFPLIYSLQFWWTYGGEFSDSISTNQLTVYRTDGSSKTYKCWWKWDDENNRCVVSCSATPNYIEEMLADTIAAFGFQTWHHGEVRIPFFPEAAGQLRERFELMQHYFADDVAL